MLTDFEDFGPEARRFHAESRMEGVARHGIPAREMTDLMKSAGFVNVDVRSHWTMVKTVEKFPGEYGKAGKAADDSQGEKMDFPFVLCYGEKPS